MAAITLSLTFTRLIKLFFLIFIIIVLFLTFKFIRSVNSSFQKYLIIFALIVLIICLIIIGATIQYSKNGTWPPEYPECPDYFDVVSSSPTGSICNNKLKLGQPRCQGIMDFSGPTFSGTAGLCNKYKWATNCKISWDGITYGVDNPCSS